MWWVNSPKANYEKLFGIWEAMQNLKYLVFLSALAFSFLIFWGEAVGSLMRPALNVILISLHNDLLAHLECFAAASTHKKREPCSMFSH